MILRVATVFLAAVAVLAVPTLVAAAGPALAATVIPGQEIDLVGSGFPADADVLLAIQRNGADAGSQALKTDAAGGFAATIDAGPGRGGVYTVTATSGSASATVEALAVETAGGLQPTPPATDAAGTASDRSDSGLSQLVLTLVAVGSVSLALSILGRRASRLPTSPVPAGRDR